MADPCCNGPMERDIEQAILALKKGACLLKYGRRGKPKFCPFRISNDGTFLIWFCGREEKVLRLSSVSKIVPGQRTAIFQRYPRPEKEYQSFSLIYENRSLDVICKDREEAEVWFSGLKALIFGGKMRVSRAEAKSVTLSEANSPVGHAKKSSPHLSSSGSMDSPKQVADEVHRSRSGYGSPRNGSGKALSEGDIRPVKLKGSFESNLLGRSVHSVGSDIEGRASSLEAFRVSMSSVLSSSSQGSGQDDGDALGDVYMWGEGVGDGILGGGTYGMGQGATTKLDALVPKAMESTVVLDVRQIACGGRHATLVTKQGEVFCWGEELGGRLGHGFDVDVRHPGLVESLANTTVELVACGEYHSCAVTGNGELYTWGDGTCGRLGHGHEVSHWTPKRVTGSLEGLRVATVACGTWHTALVTSSGQLFTFGDGTFGVLGHGDKSSALVPREVESLRGLKTIGVACGVWHTAAVVEVMIGSLSDNICSSGKLFTWGDGDKGRLGHGDQEQKLVPTCVSALVEHSVCQVVCGHSLTVALTDSGRVHTMGSPVHGQLGDPKADGKLPGRVGGELGDAFVEEVASGAFHVTVLTSKSDVYTWGKGANGRLGHGDVLDRRSPVLVEALKSKLVKSISCGSSFTMAICLHKWVSGADHSACSGCRQPFGFTRKRHNCYNCGLVFCHTCSSKKALRASMAPNPNKPYRTCDPCSVKLRKAAESSSPYGNKRMSSSSWQADGRDIQGSGDGHHLSAQRSLSRMATLDHLKHHEFKTFSRRNQKSHTSSSHVSPVRNNTARYSSFEPSKRLLSASVPHSRIVSRASSPAPSRRSSPPRSMAPPINFKGSTTSKIVEEDIKKTNQSLTQEIAKLKSQVDNLSRRCQLQDAELKHLARQLHEALRIAGEETAKCRAAKDVIKSLTAQLKAIAEHLPGDFNNHHPDGLAALPIFGTSSPMRPARPVSDVLLIKNGLNTVRHGPYKVGRGPVNRCESGLVDQDPSRPLDDRLDTHLHSEEGPGSAVCKNTENAHEVVGVEWVEQDEQGVYITLVSLPGGQRDIKRVRFSRKRFSEKQAEQWWQENKNRVHVHYNVRAPEK